MKFPAVLLVASAFLSIACEEDARVQVALDALVVGSINADLNGSGITPLSAELTFSTVVPTSVEWEVLGPLPAVGSVDPSSEHSVPVVGLYPGTENRVLVRLTDAERRFAVDTVVVATDPLPEYFPDIDIVVADHDRMEPGWTLSSRQSIGEEGTYRSQPFIFDTNGDVRWTMDLSFFGGLAYMIERFRNGNLLFAYGGAVYEYDLLGRELRRWEMPGYSYHHEVIEKPDGNLLVAVSKVAEPETVNDRVIELDRSTGAIVREWDLRRVLDVTRRDFRGDDTNWLHMNGIWYDEADDALILSGRQQGALVKVSGDNELVWILAPHLGWGPAGINGDGLDTSDFLLTAVDAEGVPFSEPVQHGLEEASNFRWSWGQHAPMILPNGNIFVFDNGVERTFSNGPPLFSRGVEYVVDEERMTVEQVWQYGEERGAEFYSGRLGDVDLMPSTGNRLIMPGIVTTPEQHALVTEVTHPASEIVFEARIRFEDRPSSEAFARVEFDLVYRSERIPVLSWR